MGYTANGIPDRICWSCTEYCLFTSI
ncbi:DUF3079 domain-containing protein [Acinetobacter courvalinii]|nr:DUF3079 domain-containing protein [Acinetobacter courvalinii]MCU4445714.1 DUF3079 domain-containing protein [Acinetobacter courvalinii]